MRGVAVVVPDAVAAAACAALRARCAWERFGRIDEGAYEHARVDVGEAAMGEVARVASAAVGRALRVVEARALRFGPGGYLLAHADRVVEEEYVEAVLDASAARVEGAAVHYRRRGAVFFAMESAPGAVAVVERGMTITSNHTYVSKRWSGAEVVRVVAILR